MAYSPGSRLKDSSYRCNFIGHLLPASYIIFSSPFMGSMSSTWLPI